MIDKERKERVAEMGGHLDALYRIFKGFCDETRPEKIPLKNYMCFVAHCLDKMIEDNERE